MTTEPASDLSPSQRLTLVASSLRSLARDLRRGSYRGDIANRDQCRALAERLEQTAKRAVAISTAAQGWGLHLYALSGVLSERNELTSEQAIQVARALEMHADQMPRHGVDPVPAEVAL